MKESCFAGDLDRLDFVRRGLHADRVGRDGCDCPDYVLFVAMCEKQAYREQARKQKYDNAPLHVIYSLAWHLETPLLPVAPLTPWDSGD